MPKITVLGSFVVDLLARSRHLPKPGQTLIAHDFTLGAGGKGQNQAVQAHLMGGETEFICKTGTDELSRIGVDFWASLGLNVRRFTDPKQKTGCANISVDEQGQNQIAVFLGANESFTEREVRDALKDIGSSGYLLLQSEINVDAIELAVDLSNRSGVPVIYNPAPYRPLTHAFLMKLFCITPNESEAASLLGWDVVNAENAKDAAMAICALGPRNTVITLGAQGCCVADGRSALMFPTFKVNAVDTVGAGDSFNGALAAMLTKGLTVKEAVPYALAASAISVQFPGSASSMHPIADALALMNQHPLSTD